MERFLLWLTARLPMRVINDGERPYLERYYLFTFLGYRFYIHRFLASDPDRGLHDHPWRRAFSIILSGMYFEETRYGLRRVRFFNALTGDSFHRVVLANGWKKYSDPYGEIPCWTLFFHTAADVKRWGFWRPLRDGLPNAEQLWIPYKYEREGGKETEWWKTAPRRGEL